MGALSPMHILLIVLVALLLFGPNKLPELGRSFGRMFREFKDATNGNSGNSSEAIHDTEPTKKELTASNEKPSAN
ncbi:MULTISPECIES: twin-arginine translocase TatA/TatE family subunit [Paenibacillus]|uniref:Sec-independent protein translocase protein TatA n=1 Tax=Paenibacillus naphthalenovorans TaxID=162209 RepID=A0A0U2ILL0_9BACL|nr:MULTISPECIES: twin-arginine translocase TatA/TatE family subunit [Paenibacillus]ALS21003.1 sec-independent protein translocase TatA/E [Paenibacillus naphthalenovorans]NTZ18769.1 twin-arginine translocase TatA/TatE family subunit [Paenibacillus sp. JMULE4]GCL71038.1 twin-arginine translocase TatA/TatE family subunit [Paenibacillus naphthalenovorans]SDI61234.1 sec-independent protein translocase protein TatA [Paenibacillus naphthalenovorans]